MKVYTPDVTIFCDSKESEKAKIKQYEAKGYVVMSPA